MKQSKLLLRTAILLQLQAASPVAIAIKTILFGIKLAGFNLNELQLLQELDYLNKKDFVAFKVDEISLGEIRYALTLSSMEYLEKRGF